MRPLPHSRAAEEPTLVPLADMLTNTVGIVLFILIFTVLATGASTVNRQFPVEHPSDALPVSVICAHGKLYAVSLEDLAHHAYPDDVIHAATVNGPPIDVTADGIDMKGVAEPGEVDRPAFTVEFLPRASGGDDPDHIAASTSALSELLSRIDAKKRFIFFFVWPDSVDAFTKARDLVLKHGLEYGWTPLAAGDPAGLVISGRLLGGDVIRPESNSP